MDKKTFDQINALKESSKPGYARIISHQRAALGRKDKTSKFRGVGLVKKGEWTAWRARINSVELGHFKTEEKAALAYNIAAKSIYGNDAFQNTIDT